ncbi:esterase/lipase family protein [Gordonia rubripertincta]|uniref:Lipase n=1 Tax=Gordonia rubripertincta TaxID=36822 RepID=A0ABT4N6T1_GORRU|nr:lipase [Gordonia rubripertincta]MCZ4553597.1 lipase [Gordonia rubripertincta]
MRGFLRHVGLSVVAAIGLAALLPATATGAPLPVSYDFNTGIIAELTNPNGSLPGTNDWSCRPSAKHPDPVVLVHGGFASQQVNWGVYGPLLKNEGYCVYTLTYGAIPDAAWPLSAIGALAPLETGAAELSAFVGRVRSSTGADKVDIVSHSQGSLTSGYYVKFLGGDAVVANLVSLGGLWEGTGSGENTLGALQEQFGLPNVPSIPFCPACTQAVSGEPFIEKLNSGGSPYVPGVRYTNISTKYDELVIPYTSGQAPGPSGTDVTNIVVQQGCAIDHTAHRGLAATRRVAAFVLNTLDPSTPRSAPCAAVEPNSGVG